MKNLVFLLFFFPFFAVGNNNFSPKGITAVWDSSDTAGIQSGAGTWDSSSARFTFETGASNSPFCQGCNVSFGGGTGTAGTITTTGTQKINSFTSEAVTGSYTISGGTLSCVDNSACLYNINQDISIGSVIDGTMGIVKNGTEILTLSGANTFTGVTTISAGTLSFGNGTAMGNIIPAGGLITNNANLVYNTPDAITHSGVISNSGNFTKTGTGSLVLTGNNTYSGTTTVTNGILDMQNTGAYTGGITVNAGATLNLNDSTGMAGAIVNDGTTNFNRSVVGFANRDDLGGQSFSGTGTVNFNNTANTPGTLDGGWVIVGDGVAVPADFFTNSGPININSGVFSRDHVDTDTINTTADFTVAAGAGFGAGRGGNSNIGGLFGSGDVGTFWTGSGSITLGNGNKNGNFTGQIRGSNPGGGEGTLDGGTTSLIKIGTGTQTLSSNNTYIGATTISAGTLTLGDGITTGNIIPAANLITNNGTLVYNNPAAVTHSGAISGTGAFFKEGAGTLTLSGNNTNSGNMDINQGRINLHGGADSAFPTINITDGSMFSLHFAWGGTHTITGSGDTTFWFTQAINNINVHTDANSTINVPGGIDLTNNSNLFPLQNFNGVLNLNGSLISGITTISCSGITGTGALNHTSGTVTYNINGSQIFSGTSNMINTSIYNIAEGATQTFSGVISNTGGLTKTGPGSLNLTGANTYSGSTTINEGTLELQGTGAYSGATTVNAGGILNLKDTTVFAGAIANNSTLNLNRSVAGFANRKVIAGNAVSGAGTVNVDSAANTLGTTDGGWVTFNGGTGSFSGSGIVNVNSGVLSRDNTQTSTINSTADFTIAAGAAFGAGRGGNSTIGGLFGAGDVGTLWSSVGSITIGNDNKNGDFTGRIRGSIPGGGDATLDGGTTSVVKIGTGTQILSGNNTYIGTTTISGGTLQIDGAGSLGSGSYAGAITNNGTFQYSSSVDQTLSGVISGTGPLIKDTNGSILTLSGVNTFSGGTVVSSGTLIHNNDSATGNNITGAITLGDANTGANDIDLKFLTGVQNINNATNFKPILVPTNPSGTVSLTFNEGTKFVNANLTINKKVTYITTGNGTQYGMLGGISGQGAGAGNDSVVFSSPPGVTLFYTAGRNTDGTGAANTFEGNVSITGGGTVTTQSLTYIDPNYINLAIPDTASVAVDAATTWKLSWGAETIDELNGSGNLNLNGFDITLGASNGSGNFSGICSGASGLTKKGTGIQILTGTNTYTGFTTVDEGTLELQNTGTYTGGSTVNSGSTLNLIDTTAYAGTLVNNGTLNLNRSVAGFANRKIIAGNAVSGFGTVNVDSAANTPGTIDGGWVYFDITDSLTVSGSVNVNSGVFSRGSTNANIINSTADFTIAANAGFGAGRGGNSNVGGLFGTGDVGTFWSGVGSITVGNGNKDGDFGGIIRGSIPGGGDATLDGGTTSVVKIGTGTQILSGNNTYIGTTTISGGTLQIDGTGSLGSGSYAGAITNNGTFHYSSGTNQAISGIISGSGNLIKDGGSILTLSGDNTFAGTTTINGGNLTLNPGGVLRNTSGIIVNNGGTLQFSGNVNSNTIGSTNKPITVNSGGTLSVTTNNSMGYSAQGNYANVILNGGTFSLSALQYINTLSLTNGTVDGSSALQFWYSVPTAIDCLTDSTISSRININSSTQTFNVANGATLNISGVIASTGFTKTGQGILNLTGLNTYTSGTTINAGTVNCGIVSAFGTGTVTVNPGGTLNMNGCGMTNAIVNNGGTVNP